MEFILSEEDIKKIKKFTKSYLVGDARNEYVIFQENKISFYIQHFNWYACLSLSKEGITENKVISTSLDAITRAVSKFSKGACVTIDFEKSKITIKGETLKNKISFKFQEEADFFMEHLLQEIPKFKEYKIKNPSKISLNTEFLDVLSNLSKMITVSTTETGTIRVSKKYIEYANKAFIYLLEYNEEKMSETEEALINASSSSLINAAYDFGCSEIEVSGDNKFFYCESPELTLISSQKKTNFQFPNEEEIQAFAPIHSECWEIKFDVEDLLKTFEEFKGVFSENSWRWEPLNFIIQKFTNIIKISYSDIKISEEKEYVPLDINTQADISSTQSYLFTISTQLIRMLIEGKKVVSMNVYPADDGLTSIGIMLRLSEKEIAILPKLQRM